MTNNQAIVSLIKILGKPYKCLIFPLEIGGETWDGIRLIGRTYELFQYYKLSKEEADFYGTEDSEFVLGSEFITDEDEELIKNILEKILLEL